ncbi:MAG: choice-of-anchor D domain-containing protein [Ignavibacteriae bacterium]|nr:choice-of-anchor D domain-containing protein [Ignavibacteriota bacterium]
MLEKIYLKSPLLIFVILILSNYSISIAYDFYHFKTDYSKYPSVEINGILINNNLPQNFGTNNLIISENAKQSEIISSNCNFISNSDEQVNILILIDYSASMLNRNANLVRNTLIEIFQDVELNNLKIGIMGFNHQNYFISDFNSNFDEIFFPDDIPNSGFNDITNALANATTGAIEILKKLNGRKEILLISNGSESGNLNTLRNQLIQNNIRLNAIALDFNPSQIIKQLSESTSGFSLGKIINNDALNSAVKGFLYLAEFQDACTISYKSFTCQKDNILNLNFTEYGISRNLQIEIPEYNHPRLLIEPKYHYFGLRLPPAKPTVNISLTALNGDIQIDEFIDNEYFRVTTQPKNFLLRNGESKTITIEFLPKDSSYIFRDIEIHGSFCNAGRVSLAGGSDRLLEIDKTIRVTAPNGGESLPAGSYYTITWEGTLPSDTVKIEYSTNGGSTWNKITNSAFGNSFVWRNIPNTISNNCLLNVSQLSKYDLSRNIISLNGILGNVVELVWRNDLNEIYTGSTDGFIRLWNASTGEPIRTVIGGISELKDFDVSSLNNYYCFITANSNKISFRNIDNEFEESSITVDGEIISSVDWNPENNFIAAATESGKVFLFDFPSATASKIYSYSNQITSVEWDKSGSKLSVGFDDGFVRVIDLTTDQVTHIKASDQRINSVRFNPLGSVIVTSSMNEIIRVWDVSSGNNLTSFVNNRKPVNALAWDPAAKFIASSSADSAVSLWQPGTGNKFYTFTGHNNMVNNIKWRHDGGRIASSTIQGEVFIWTPDDIPFSRPTLQEDVSDSVWSIVNPTLTSKNVNFPILRVGDAIDSNITAIIKNPNSYPIYIDTIIIRGASRSFSISSEMPLFPVSLNSGDSINLMIRFNPESSGSKLDTLLFLSGLREYRSFLFGYAEDKLIEISPAVHDFGIVKIGFDSDIFRFNIINLGTSDIYIESISPILNPDNQYQTVGFSPGFIPSGNQKSVEMVFNPSSFAMSGAVFDVVYDGKIGNDFVTLSGAGAAPQINYLSEISLSDIVCENTASQEIWIKNIGNEVLRINSIELSESGNDSFEIDLSNTNFEIIEKDSTSILLNFSNSLAGNFETEIIINSDINADKSTINNIRINIRKEISNYKLHPSNLSFYVFETSTEDFSTLKLINDGTISGLFEIPDPSEHFSIESIEPQFTNPGDTASVLVRFSGTVSEGLYSENISFIDTCGNVKTLILAAYVGPSDARIEAGSEINFPDILCWTDTIYQNLKIKNAGTTPLIISSFEFIDENTSFFIEDDILLNKIDADSEILVKFGFRPLKSGNYTDKFRLKTNDGNLNDGIFDVVLNGFFGIADFKLSDDRLEIDELLENETHQYIFEIINTGNIELRWELPEIRGNFSIDSIVPPITLPQEKSFVFATFNGGASGFQYAEIAEFKNVCNTNRTILLSAITDGQPRVGIRAGEVSAKPGDTITVPIEIFSINGTNLPDVEGYKFTLAFNPTLIVPLDDEFEGYIKSDGKRHLTYTAVNVNGNENSYTLNLNFLATLGNAESTELILTNPKAIGNSNMKIQTYDGAFYLDSLCYENGVRLIGNYGRLRLGQNFPNPVSTETTVKFSVIETGRHSISIFNMLGNEVRTIFDDIIIPGEYQVQFNIHNLPIGNYIYKLSTPTTRLTRKMTVNR